MKVKVKFKDNEAKELYLKASDNKSIFPFKTHENDFCFDCVATSCEEIAPNVYKYGLGIALQIVRDEYEPVVGAVEYVGYGFENEFSTKTLYENLSIDARPRSSVWKTGMSLSNCLGTIDEGFNAEISAVFYHVMPNMPKYEVGDKVVQIKLGRTIPMSFVEVEELDETSRNGGAYGSTGK